MAEADNLELARAKKSVLDDAEKRLLGKRYPKRRLGGASFRLSKSKAISLPIYVNLCYRKHAVLILVCHPSRHKGRPSPAILSSGSFRGFP